MNVTFTFVTLQEKRKQIREATDLCAANGALMTAHQECGLYLLHFRNHSMYTFLPSNQNKRIKTDH